MLAPAVSPTNRCWGLTNMLPCLMASSRATLMAAKVSELYAEGQRRRLGLPGAGPVLQHLTMRGVIRPVASMPRRPKQAGWLIGSAGGVQDGRC